MGLIWKSLLPVTSLKSQDIKNNGKWLKIMKFNLLINYVGSERKLPTREIPGG